MKQKATAQADAADTTRCIFAVDWEGGRELLLASPAYAGSEEFAALNGEILFKAYPTSKKGKL